MNTYVVIALVISVLLSSATVAYFSFGLHRDNVGEPCALAPEIHNCRPGLICDHESGTCQKRKPHQEPN